MEIDKLDKGILGLLQADSRLSSRKIAEYLEVSPTTVSERIKVLKNNGIIKRFTIQINPDTLGMNCSLLLMLKVAPGRDIEAVEKELAKIKEACYIYRITGEHNFVVISIAKDRTQAMNILNKVSRVEGITDVHSSWILETVKEKSFPRDCLN